MRLSGAVSDGQVAELITNTHALVDVVEFLPLNSLILQRASESFRTALGTLDALHLATALWLVQAAAIDLTFLTHDGELALAARSVNFAVEGA